MISLLKKAGATFHPSGGVLYHYLALKYRKKLWAPFINQLEAWMDHWNPQKKDVVLVGPSGGYCLPPKFLDRFKKVSAVDPDPVAAAIFKRKIYSEDQTDWDYQDYFAPRKGAFDPRRIEAFFKKYKGRAIVFCNVLGQITLSSEDNSKKPSFPDWHSALLNGLEKTDWLSFHDRISFAGTCQSLEGGYLSKEELSNIDLVDQFLAHTSTPVIDHQTEKLFGEGPRVYFSWEIHPGRQHIIEGCRS